MKHVYRLLPLAIAAILAGMAISRGHRTHAGAPINGARVTLGELAAKPLDYLGGEAHFTFAVESQPPSWNPYLTRFGPGDYRAVVAWGDEQRLWIADDYARPPAMLFARRGSEAEARLASAERYARLEATGIVRQVHLGRPWIELTDVVVLPQQFTEGSLIHASRGVELLAAEHWTLAAQSFERALASDLPESARIELERLRATAVGRASALIPIGPRKKP